MADWRAVRPPIARVHEPPSSGVVRVGAAAVVAPCVHRGRAGRRTAARVRRAPERRSRGVDRAAARARAACAASERGANISTASTCWPATSTRWRPASRSTSGALPPRLRPLVWLSGGRIRWRTIQTVLDAGYVDAFRVSHPERSRDDVADVDPHVRLDYVFVPQHATARLVGCDVVRHPSAAAASDHFPVVADFDDAPPG